MIRPMRALCGPYGPADMGDQTRMVEALLVSRVRALPVSPADTSPTDPNPRQQEPGRVLLPAGFYDRWQGWGLEFSGKGAGEGMTYYEAALQVLRSVRHPLTTREITDQAIERGLITPRGKTPNATMSARLYVGVRNSPDLVKLEAPGNGRARRGSVRWTLRRPTAAVPRPKR
jgi:hypothetical protein